MSSIIPQSPDPIQQVSQLLPLDILVSYRPEEDVPNWVDRWYNRKRFKLLTSRYPDADPGILEMNHIKVFWSFIFHNNMPVCLEWEDERIRVDFLRSWAVNSDIFWVLRYKPFYERGIDGIPKIENDIGFFYVNDKDNKYADSQVMRLFQLFQYLGFDEGLPVNLFPSLYVPDLILSNSFVLMNAKPLTPLKNDIET
jgi:hypothetical protein